VARRLAAIDQLGRVERIARVAPRACRGGDLRPLPLQDRRFDQGWQMSEHFTMREFLVTYRVAVLPPNSADDLSGDEFEEVLCDMLDREDTRALDDDEEDAGVIRGAFEILGAHEPAMAGAAPGNADEIDFTAVHSFAFDPPATDDDEAQSRIEAYLGAGLGVGQYDGPWFILAAEVHPR
jgi:hypothetical protein